MNRAGTEGEQSKEQRRNRGGTEPTDRAGTEREQRKLIPRVRGTYAVPGLADRLKLSMREMKQRAARHYDTPGSQGISHPVLMGLNGD